MQAGAHTAHGDPTDLVSPFCLLGTVFTPEHLVWRKHLEEKQESGCAFSQSLGSGTEQ